MRGREERVRQASCATKHCSRANVLDSMRTADVIGDMFAFCTCRDTLFSALTQSKSGVSCTWAELLTSYCQTSSCSTIKSTFGGRFASPCRSAALADDSVTSTLAHVLGGSSSSCSLGYALNALIFRPWLTRISMNVPAFPPAPVPNVARVSSLSVVVDVTLLYQTMPPSI